MGSWHTARRAKLPNWTLVFNKARSDGSSAANIHPAAAEVVWGVIYEIIMTQLHQLAAYEKDYRLEQIEVALADGSQVRVRTFVAEADKVQEGIPPSREYLSKILVGAEEHGLSETYRHEIARKAQTQRKGGVQMVGFPFQPRRNRSDKKMGFNP